MNSRPLSTETFSGVLHGISGRVQGLYTGYGKHLLGKLNEITSVKSFNFFYFNLLADFEFGMASFVATLKWYQAGNIFFCTSFVANLVIRFTRQLVTYELLQVFKACLGVVFMQKPKTKCLQLFNVSSHDLGS